MLLALSASACKTPPNPNPAAPFFDAKSSDPQAIAIADETMAAMGGRPAWDQTRCLAWTFFKTRHHVWDKWTGAYQLQEGSRVVNMNLNTGEGSVLEQGAPLADPQAIAQALKRAKSVWINDSYWLIMPYKLKDDGVTLRYVGERPLPDGRPADVLELTFAEVGDTPLNQYEVWVSRDKKLVEQWAYFAHRDDAEPKFVTPWEDWKRYGEILLSSDRGEGKQLTDIAVSATLMPELE